MRVSSPPLSEVKKQALRDELQTDLTSQVEGATGKIQDIVFQRIALEVPHHVQKFEQDLKKELNSVFQFRMESIFKSLNASFNLKVKFCLNKLGYDLAGINLTPFDNEDAPAFAKSKLFTSPTPKYNPEKEVKAIDRDISRLERSISSSKQPVFVDRSLHSDFGVREHVCDHLPFAFKTELKNDLFDQLGQEVRATTEFLMENSNCKLNDIVRNETHQVHQRMMAELHRNIDKAEEEFKSIFEDLIQQKVNELVQGLGGSAPQNMQIAQRQTSPQQSPVKQLYTTLNRGSEKKTKLNQELERLPKEELGDNSKSNNHITSPPSHNSPKINSPTKTDNGTDFSQTKGRIERLKHSLNFIDESAFPTPDRYFPFLFNFTYHELRNEDQYRNRDSQLESRRGLHYSQLEPEEFIPSHDRSNTKPKGITFAGKPDFMETIKKEYNDNIQAASKLEELKSFYQKRYGNISMSKAETPQ